MGSEPNVWFILKCPKMPKSEWFWSDFGCFMSWNQTSLMNVWLSDVKKCPKTELFCSGFGHFQNTEPTENGTEVEHPRTKLVPILDVDCIWSIKFILFFFLQLSQHPFFRKTSIEIIFDVEKSVEETRLIIIFIYSNEVAFPILSGCS